MSRRLWAVALTAMLAIAVAGCGKPHQATGDDLTKVKDRLAAAKVLFDKAPAVTFTLSTQDHPTETLAILTATGYTTRQPGFQGSIKLALADLSVRALNDTVWVKGAGLFPKWTVVNPADIGAPNPATFLNTTDGLSSLLTALTGLDTGSQKRDGRTIVTTYSGKLAGTVVDHLIPIADKTSTFTATVSLTDANRFTAATLTGPFYKKGINVTYTVTAAECTTCAPVTAPTP